MKPKQKAAIERHGRDLQAIFPAALGAQGPLDLCRKLRRLESKGQAVALRLCNGPEYPEGEADRLTNAILQRVCALLGVKPDSDLAGAIFVNRDPRGYALKIQDEYMRAHDLKLHRDMGGYGILAPEITGD